MLIIGRCLQITENKQTNKQKQILNNSNKVNEQVLFFDEFWGGINSKLKETWTMVFFKLR